MDFFSSISRGIGRFFNTGNDTYTQPFSLGTAFIQRLLSGSIGSEEWLTMSDNEFKYFKSTAELYIPIMMKAGMLTNGKWIVKDYKTGEEIEDNDLHRLLDSPAVLFTRKEWLERACIDLSLYGNFISRIQKGSSLSLYPTSINPLPIYDTKIDLKGVNYNETEIEDIIKAYIIGSSRVRIEPSEVLHLKLSNPENPAIGLSPLHALQMPITNIRGAYGFRNVNIRKKGGLGIISPKVGDAFSNKLSEESRTDIEKQFQNETHGIGDKQSALKMSPVGVEYNPLSYPLRNQMLFEEVTENFNKIVDALGLNINIFSREKGTTFNNYSEGMKSSYQNGVIPMGEMIADGISRKLGLYDRGLFLELNFDHVSHLQEDENIKSQVQQRKAQAIQTLISVGYTREEAMEIIKIS